MIRELAAIAAYFLGLMVLFWTAGAGFAFMCEVTR